MNFKDRFYEKYASTHVTHRKGEASLETFRINSFVWKKHFGPLLPSAKTAKIIDVGCGSGGLVWWLHQHGFTNTEGVDLSREQVEAARRLGVPNVYQADLKAHLTSRSGYYDQIILRDVIEHFTREEILEILALCRVALRAGGTIVAQVPNAESPFFGRIRYGDFTHEMAFTSASLIQLFGMVGLEEIRVYPTDPAARGPASLARLLLWKVITACYGLLAFAELGRGRRIFTQGLIAVGRVPTTGRSS